MDLPRWIRTTAELETLARALGRERLHLPSTPRPTASTTTRASSAWCRSPTTRGRRTWWIRWRFRRSAPLGPLFADPRIEKVLHAADNDLAYLKRLYGFSVASLFDTAVAARFLGAQDAEPRRLAEGVSRGGAGQVEAEGRLVPPAPDARAGGVCARRCPASVRRCARGSRRSSGPRVATPGSRRSARRWRRSTCPTRSADPDAYLEAQGREGSRSARLGGAARALPGARSPGARARPTAVHDHRARDAWSRSPRLDRIPWTKSWRCRAAPRAWSSGRGRRSWTRSRAARPCRRRSCHRVDRPHARTCLPQCVAARRRFAPGARRRPTDLRPRSRRASPSAADRPAGRRASARPRRARARWRASGAGVSTCSARSCSQALAAT